MEERVGCICARWQRCRCTDPQRGGCSQRGAGGSGGDGEGLALCVLRWSVRGVECEGGGGICGMGLCGGA